MSSRENRYPWLIIIGASIAGAALAAALFPSEPALEPVYLPPKHVRVEVESAAAMAKAVVQSGIIHDLTLVNGQLRDENGVLSEAVELLQVKTEAAPAPEAEKVATILRKACEEKSIPDLVYDADIIAVKFRGIGRDGKLAYGWRGRALCSVSADGADFALLHSKPFTLENTEAVTSTPPVAPRRPKRWYAGLHVALITDTKSFGFSLTDYQSPATFAFNPASFRLYAGKRFFPLKRWKFTPRLGVFADANAVGVDVGVVW